MSHIINKVVEPFHLHAFCQGQFTQVTEKDLLGKWTVFFFYPADFSFVCPTELSDLQDYKKDFDQINCQIFSVSTDSHYVHKAWADASDTIRRITYTMLSDPAFKLSEDFGVLLKEEGQALRGTFIVNPEGVIKAYEIHDLGIGRNAEELLRKVQAAQFTHENGGKVCPAKWKPGEETLIPSFDLVGKL